MGRACVGGLVCGAHHRSIKVFQVHTYMCLLSVHMHSLALLMHPCEHSSLTPGAVSAVATKQGLQVTNLV